MASEELPDEVSLITFSVIAAANNLLITFQFYYSFSELFSYLPESVGYLWVAV